MPRLAALLALSGAASLIHQVVWFRVLTLALGSSVHAAAAVLSGFMAGMALGSLAGGDVADRVDGSRRRWMAFAAVEAGTALAAFCLPPLLRGASAPLAPSLLIAIPAALIGASMPLALRIAGVASANAPRAAALIAGNAAGALAGVLTSALVTIPVMGLRKSTLLAVLLNLVAAIGALAMTVRRDEAEAQNDAATPPATRARADWVLVAAAVSGFATFALEILWLRILSAIALRPTAYTFALILSAVLAGLAAGGLAAARVLRHSRQWHTAAGLSLVAASACALAFTHLVSAAVRAFAWPVVAAAAFGGIFATALCLGFCFPAVLSARVAVASPSVSGRRAGDVVAVNVVSAAFGALGATFLLLPHFGTRGSFAAVIAVLAFTGAMLALRRQQAWSAVVLAVTAAGAGAFVSDMNAAALAGRFPGHTLLWRKEAAQATVAVHVEPGGVRTLWVNGIHQANDSADAVAFHRLLAELPLDLHPSPRRYLSVGLGAGITAGAAAARGALRVDIVEISPEVAQAAALFAHANKGLLQRPNARIFLDDARAFLRRSAGAYDVITADPIVPRLAGGGILSSEEYFRSARGSLAGAGLFAKWIGPTEDTAWKLIARTFLRVFPDATLWSDRILLAGLGPGWERKVEAYRGTTVFTAGPEALRAFVGEGPILTDDQPRVEYFLSLPEHDPPIDLSPLKGGTRKYLKR